MTSPGDAHAVEVVTRLCQGWHTIPRAELAAMFTDDAVYRTMPHPRAVIGGAAIAEVFASGKPFVHAVEVEMGMVGTGPDVVFAERVETIEPISGEPIVVPVAGVFEFRGPHISAWRDYCDVGLLRPLQTLMAGGTRPSGAA